MLALTDTARTVIRDLTSSDDVPEGSGLRIAPTAAGELELSLVTAPAPGDEVIDSGGARLFVEPQTAEILADQVLDAEVGAEGTGFYLTLTDSADLDGGPDGTGREGAPDATL